MMKIECEICGYSLVKTTKHFVCENCGACYSTEYLKELLNKEEKQEVAESEVEIIQNIEKDLVEEVLLDEVALDSEVVVEDTSSINSNTDIIVGETVFEEERVEDTCEEVLVEDTPTFIFEEKPKVKKKNFFIRVKDFLYKVFIEDIENTKLKKAISIVGLIATILFIASIMLPSIVVLFESLEAALLSLDTLGEYVYIYNYLNPFNVLYTFLKVGLGVSLILYLSIPKLRKNSVMSKVLFLASLYFAVSSIDITYILETTILSNLDDFYNTNLPVLIIKYTISSGTIFYVFAMYFYFRELSGFTFKTKEEKNIYDYILLGVVYGAFCIYINLAMLNTYQIFFYNVTNNVQAYNVSFTNFSCDMLNHIFILNVGVSAFTLVFIYRKRISSILIAVFGSMPFFYLMSKGLFLNFVNMATGKNYTILEVINTLQLGIYDEFIPTVGCNAYFVIGIIYAISVVALYVLRDVMSKKTYRK